jgi:hypothetical protein
LSHLYNKEDTAKAYSVEAHMAAFGVSPEEHELATLLDLSSKARDADKVDEYMHKRRQAVDCVRDATSKVLEGCSSTKKASRVECCSGEGCHCCQWWRVPREEPRWRRQSRIGWQRQSRIGPSACGARSKCDLEGDLGKTIALIHFLQGKIIFRILYIQDENRGNRCC